MKINKFIYLILLYLVCAIEVNAQQDNLWTTEFGSRSALTGGAVTASVRDNSAIFYNPGALGFIKSSNIGLSANIVNFYSTYIKDGAGEGSNMYYPYFNFVPQFLSGVVKLKQVPDVTFTYAVFNKQKSKLTFFQKSNEKIDLFPQYPGDEDFYSSYQYNNEILETWVGVGAGYLLSPKWSVGLTTFFSYRSEINYESIDNVVFNDNKEIVANTIFSNQLNLDQLAVLFKAGVAYEDEYVNWGATITTSGIRINLFTGALIERKENVIMPGVKDHYYQIYNDWTDAWYKHPWEFDTGIQFAMARGVLSARITYFGGADPYTVVKFDDESIVSSNTGTPLFPKKNEVKYASKPVVNFAFGFEREITDNIILLSGFKVDNNVFDSENLDREEYWVTTKSYWNLYTTSLGADYKTNRGNNLIFGISYRFTNRKGDKQIVNITNPDVNNYLLGPKTSDTATNIYGFSLVLGYTYNFGGSNKKDILDKLKLQKLNPFGDE